MRRGRLDSLTGLRALAAAVVFLDHVPPLLSGHLAGAESHIGVQGAIGVTFFFALSGLVLQWSARDRDTVRAFYRRRAARVYPAYAVACAAGGGARGGVPRWPVQHRAGGHQLPAAAVLGPVEVLLLRVQRRRLVAVLRGAVLPPVPPRRLPAPGPHAAVPAGRPGRRRRGDRRAGRGDLGARAGVLPRQPLPARPLRRVRPRRHGRRRRHPRRAPVPPAAPAPRARPVRRRLPRGRAPGRRLPQRRTADRARAAGPRYLRPGPSSPAAPDCSAGDAWCGSARCRTASTWCTSWS